MRKARRFLKILRVLAISAFLALVLLFASLWIDHRTSTTLPAPTGPYAVGRSIEAWTGDAHPDTLAPVPQTKRELVVWIWYPAQTGAAGASPSATTQHYLPASWQAAIEHSRGALISKFLTRDLSRVHAHSVRNSGLSPRQPSYPVVIMRGGASAEVANYTTLAEDLASHGYIVVGFDAPYRTGVVVFPDGRTIARTPENNPESCLGRPDQESCAAKLLAAWTADIAWVLDRLNQLNQTGASTLFKGRLDLNRVGVFGHSFGGAAAALFCSEDARCKAGIDIDGALHGSVLQTGINRPFLFLMSDHRHESDPESRQILANIQSIYDRLPEAGRLHLAIRGANHFLFSDDGALLKSHIVLGVLRTLGILGIDGRRQLAVTAYCVHSFFDSYLKTGSASRLQISSPLYPEIQNLR